MYIWQSAPPRSGLRPCISAPPPESDPAAGRRPCLSAGVRELIHMLVCVYTYMHIGYH